MALKLPVYPYKVGLRRLKSPRRRALLTPTGVSTPRRNSVLTIRSLIEAREACGEASGDLVLGGLDPGSDLFDREALRPLRADADGRFAWRDVGDIGHVHHGLIHADAAEDQGAPAAQQKVAAIGEAAGQAVAIADQDRRDPAGPRQPAGGA